jgi:catecholate siderophore receptor
MTSKRAFVYLLSPLLAAMLAAVPLAAQEEAVSSQKPTDSVAEEVEVEGQPPQLPALSGVAARLPGDDLPASLSVISQPLLQDQMVTTLSDALQNVAGINVQTGNGPFDLFFLRGFDSVSSALVLVDGAPEPESTMLHLYNVDQVEVLKGAGGFLYGGRALAGTVNLARKAPVPRSFVNFALEAGSYSFFEAQVDANHEFSDNAGLRVNGLWQKADNFRDAESDVWAINPTFAWKNDRTRLVISYERLDEERLPDAGVPLVAGIDPQELADYEYASSYDNSDQKIDRFQLNLEHQLRGEMKLRAKVYHTRLDWESDGTLISGGFYFPPFFEQTFRTLTELDDTQRMTGLQVELAATAETGSVRHEILAGVELGSQKDEFSLRVGLLGPTAIFNPAIPANEPFQPFPQANRIGKVEADILSPYVVDRMVFSDRFELLAGARFDRIDLEGEGTALGRKDEEVSPFLGLVLRASDQISFYAQYSSSFEPPSSLTVGEAEPEEGEQIELGLRYQAGNTVASVSVYQLEKTNIAIPSNQGILRRNGDQESRGVEVELTGRTPAEMAWRFSYAYTDAELVEFTEFVQTATGFVFVDYAGNTPTFAPEHLASLWLSKRFANGFGFGVGSRYVGEQFVDNANTWEIDSAIFFDAAAFYAFDKWQVNVAVENIGDEETFYRAFTQASVVPAAGTTVKGGIRLVL